MRKELNLPDGVIDQLKYIADRKGVSVKKMMEIIIVEHVKTEKRMSGNGNGEGRYR